MWFPVHSSKDSSKSLIKKPLPFAGEASLSFGLEAADNTEGGEQGRESGNNHLDDCLDNVLFHNLNLNMKKARCP
jgi:hypothetical protein